MCGIVGLVAFDAPLERARGIVAAMNEHIEHRGPDGEGLTAHQDATLAMKRLAVVESERRRIGRPEKYHPGGRL